MKQPRQRSGGDTFSGGMPASAGLFVLASIIALLLTVLTVAGSWTVRLVTVLGPRLAGDATVIVWGRGLESADAAAARAVEILSARPGTRAVALEPDASDTWIGALVSSGGPGVEGPRLVAVDVPSPDASIAGAIRSLRDLGITVVADDHRGSDGPLERRAILTAAITAGTALVLCGVLFLASWAAARTLIVRHDRRIALMIRMGARTGFLAGLVRRQVGFGVAAGGVFGLLVGEALALLSVPTVLTGTLPVAGPALVDGAAAIPWPLLLFLIAFAGAGLGAGGALKQMARVG